MNVDIRGYAALPADDQIDLRDILRVPLKYRWLVLALGLVAALLAFGTSFFAAPSYEASALVILNQPRYQLSFDPKFETVLNNERRQRAIASLALAPQVLSSVIQSHLSDVPSELRNVEELRARLTVKTLLDPNMLELIGEGSNPVAAANLTNAWAQEVISATRQTYGETQADVVSFERELEQRLAELTAAETTLSSFQARNELGMLDAQLSAVRDEAAYYRAQQAKLDTLAIDISRFSDQLDGNGGDSPTSIGDELVEAQLMMRAFGGDRELEGMLQFQIGSTTSAKRTNGQLRDYMNQLVTNVGEKAASMSERAERLAPRILKLQEQVQQADSETQRLQLQLEMARQTYQTLGLKLTEMRIAATELASATKIAAQAMPPGEPAGMGIRLRVLIAAVLGIAMGFVLSLVLEWWKHDERTAASQPRPATTRS